ncbi:MAG: N-acetyltransferase [Silvanigrellales bacterium]|jgi:UDP-2-acetamido-3-amino-2,3-dideoxy-glucuronate N-acetyltransferase|nr:N-acetyltransferase [Silvanigrellales bacterium]
MANPTFPGVTIHPSAIVDEGARLGEGSRVWHWVHVSPRAVIGKSCSLGQNVYIGNDVTIGNNVKIQNNVSVYDAVTLEDDVFCGPSMVFTNVINPRSHVVRKHEYKHTVVRKGATIGANATIVCGTELGAFCFIAAGAVITKNVAPYALMAGVPAKRIGWMSENGVRLHFKEGIARCEESGGHYRLLHAGTNSEACEKVSL